MAETNENEARQRALDEFAISRAKAINTYADLERSLATLFEALLGADLRKSFAVFAIILTARGRLDIINTLLKLEHGDRYKTFFDSLYLKLVGISGLRNRIIHWILLQSTTGGQPFKPRTDVFLNEHPDIYAGGKFYKHEVDDFTRRANFYRLLIFYFGLNIKSPAFVAEGNPDKRPWQDIFTEKVSYPPPADHPLSDLS